jgi:tetratricopeptide (TPR) repeat protein
VFRFNGEHFEARKELADALYGRGDQQAAYSEYLRLAEQYPDNALVRQQLTFMALLGQAWEEADRHGRRALELAPDAAVNPPIRVSLDYRAAALAEDGPKLDALAEEAAALMAADPTDILSRRIVLAHAVSQDRPGAVLEVIDPAIEQYPDDIGYYVLKLRALTALEDVEGIETHLQAMYRQFPENEDVQRSLISFYLQRQDFAGAEAFLRDLAGPDTGEPQGFIPVIQLIERAQGRDAAKAEVQRLIDANAENADNAAFFKALLASFQFEDGERDAAVADLQALVETLEPSDQTRRIKGTLANMLLRTGNQVGARALAEEILEEDASNVVALKLRAQLLIDGDQPAEAIADLRRALDQSPRDVETLLLLAAAHERNGNTALQGERLAIAVDVSNSAPRESLLYADFLLRQNRTDAARSVLADARNANPRNVDVLSQVARLALAENALGVVRGVIADLERIPEDPRAAEVAVALQSALLLQQNRADEGLALLQQQAGSGGENTGAVFAVIQTQLRSGRVGEARTYLDGLLAESPGDENLRLINAALHVAEGNPEESERILREMIAENPAQQTAVGQLYVQLRRQGRVEDARAVLNAGLEAVPDGARLLQYQAGELEAMGDIEGAIAIYEDLYDRNSSNVTVANNLASLISTFRDTDESLERAAAVARRLRGTDIPAFQDTYGWIAYRQGNYAEALEYLQPAAQGLPNNPLVQFHLGMTYLAVDRPEEARTQLERALELAGPDTTLPQMTTARETLEQLAGQ